jgi:hypothetical protein
VLLAVFSFTYSDTEIVLLSKRLSGCDTIAVPLPAGLVRAGRINDQALFGKILSQAMTNAKPNPIRSKHVVIGLPEEQAFIKMVNLPKKLNRSEIQKSLGYQWQSILPIPPDLAYYDFTVIKPSKKPPKTEQNQQVLVIAYPSEIVNTLIAIIKTLGLTPTKVIPASFGLARAFSSKEPTPTLIVESSTGYDVPVTIVQKGVTRFSTIIHAPVNSPMCAKQLDNIRSFYERSIGVGETIKRVVLLPGPYTQVLTQTVASLKLPAQVAPAEKLLKTAKLDLQHTGRYLYLTGLLDAKTKLTILPTSLLEAQEATHQISFMRTMAFYIAATLGIAVYISIVILSSVRFGQNNQGQYSEKFSNYLATEDAQTTEEVSKLNQSLIGIPAPTLRLADMGEEVKKITTLAQSIPDFNMVGIVVDNEKKGRSVIAVPKDHSRRYGNR